MAQEDREFFEGETRAMPRGFGPVGPAALDVVTQVVELLEGPGRRAPCDTDAGVSLLAHALQTAHLAERARAPRALVAAALLHDVGHLLARPADAHPCDDVHELRALGLLGSAFGRDVLEPVRLHVQAKRYLCTTDPRHAAALPPAARASLVLQGGRMSRDEVWLFEDTPYAEQAVALRRWDDAAHMPGKVTPPLDYFVDLLHEVRPGVGGAPRAGSGSIDIP